MMEPFRWLVEYALWNCLVPNQSIEFQRDNIRIQEKEL